MCAGFGMLGLAGLLGRAAPLARSAVAVAIAPHLARQAKRVIFLFMNGGPSHVDTFDPKPALAKYEGQQPTGELYKKNKGTGFMPSPLKFDKCGQSGIEVSETLPNIAQRDRRLLRHPLDAHRRARTTSRRCSMMHTGNVQPIRPSLGSWLLYGLGTREREPARLRRAAPEPQDRGRPGAVEQQLPARRSTRRPASSPPTCRSTSCCANIKNPRARRASSSASSSTCSQQLNHHHLRQRDGDAELEGADQDDGDGLPHAGARR